MSRAPQHVPTPWQVQKAMQQVHDAMAALQETISPDAAEDATLILDTIEGQTDAFETIDALVGASVEAFELAKAARERATLLAERAARFERRRDALRALVLDMMQVMEQSKIERAGYTVAVRQNAPELIINEAELPEMYFRIKREVDRAALRKLFARADGRVTIPGVTVGNASQGITVRI